MQCFNGDALVTLELLLMSISPDFVKRCFVFSQKNSIWVYMDVNITSVKCVNIRINMHQ